MRKNKDVILKSKLRVAVGAVTQDDNKALVEGELEVQRLKAMVKQARYREAAVECNFLPRIRILCSCSNSDCQMKRPEYVRVRQRCS